MIIDFHTHIFPDKIAEKTINILATKSNINPYMDGTVNGLLTHMNSANVDISISLPVLTKPSQFDGTNRFAMEINQSFSSKKTKIISFAGIHPLCEDIKGKMKLIKEWGFLGVKIHPDYQDAYINDEGYYQILKSAKDLDLIVVTHAGVDYGYPDQPVKCPPELCLEVINKVNHDKFVLGHFGGHNQWKDVLIFLAGKNVFFDTAFTLHEIDSILFNNIVDKHGVDKILFATDCPWCGQEQYISLLKSFNLGIDAEDKIFYKNAKKLLQLEE